MRILVAEDQPELRRMLVKNLTAAGCTVDGVPDGEGALAYLDAADYDVAVLDIMMPKVDGLTVLRTLRGRDGQLPVLLLTARDAVADRVGGLDAGADDYLIKPFALDELLARLRVLTRKKGSGRTNVYTLADLTVDTAGRTAQRNGRTLELSAREYALLEYLMRNKGVILSRQQIENNLWSLDYAGRTNVYTLADLTVDTAGRTAQRNGRTLELSAREYALLEYLMRNKGVILSRQQIENNLWSLDYAGGTNVVDVYISYLRKKLELPGEARLLHTVRGMGWVLKEDA